jgi:4'-phosphopantetheinyl transferase
MLLIPWQAINRWYFPSYGSPLMVSAQLEGETSARYLDLLSEGEKARAARLKNRAEAERWVIAHGILRLVLGQILQMAPRVLRFEKNWCQKPFLSYPSDSRLSFNISHSGSLLLIGLAREKQIGVDLEVMDGGRDFAAIAPLVFSPGEQALLSQSSNPLQDFYALWTAKEALLKAAGCGFSFPPRQVQLTIKDHIPTLENLPFELSKDGDCTLTTFQLEKGYAVAVAILNEPSVSMQPALMASPYLSRMLVS